MKKHFILKKRSCYWWRKAISVKGNEHKIHWFSRLSPKHASEEHSKGCETNIAVLLLQHFHFWMKPIHIKAKGMVLSIYIFHNKNAKRSILFPCNRIYATDKATKAACDVSLQPSAANWLVGFLVFFFFVDMHVYIDTKSQTIPHNLPSSKKSYHSFGTRSSVSKHPRIHHRKKILDRRADSLLP